MIVHLSLNSLQEPSRIQNGLVFLMTSVSRLLQNSLTLWHPVLPRMPGIALSQATAALFARREARHTTAAHRLTGPGARRMLSGYKG